MSKRLAKQPTTLKPPKATSKRLELDLFRLTGGDINKNHGIKKVWDSYSGYFDSLRIKEKIKLNEIMSRLLGHYWVMVRQGRANQVDYELRKSLVEYSELERKYIRRRY